MATKMTNKDFDRVAKHVKSPKLDKKILVFGGLIMGAVLLATAMGKGPLAHPQSPGPGTP